MLWQPLNLTEACPANSQITACTSFGYVYLNLLVQLYGDSKDRRIQEKLGSSYQDGRLVDDIDKYADKYKKEEYDFIVVGAGAAGCVVTNRLSANKNWKVLLLEAGGEQPDVTLVPALSTALLGSNIDWRYSTMPNGKSCLARPGGRCAWPRGKVMGGSTSINTMVYVRGNKADYDGWAALGNEGWSYKDVLRYFKRYEKNLNIEGQNRKYHGVDGEQPVSRYPYSDRNTIMLVDAFNERGLPLIDVNAAHQLGAIQIQTYSQDGVRYSVNNGFIQPIRYKRKNLTVRVNCEVFKILIDEDNHAYGVKYKNNGRVRTAYAKKEVIISGGSINSPKLLMLSGIGPKAHLSRLNIQVKQDLDVGKNLQDHASFFGLLVGLKKTSTLIGYKQMMKEVYDYKEMKMKHGPISANGPTNIGVFIKSDSNLIAPNVQIGAHYAIVHDALIDPVTFESCRIFPTSFYDAVYARIQNVQPNSRGKIELNATNPHGSPLIYPNYFEDPSDMIPMLIAAKYFLSLEDTHAFKSVGAKFIKIPLPACRNYSWGSDNYILCLMRQYTVSIYHPVGTCKMGPRNDQHAVVDPKLRVYGVSGLRVVDASIMPRIVRGNTNAAVLMIGEKSADLIFDKWL